MTIQDPRNPIVVQLQREIDAVIENFIALHDSREAPRQVMGVLITGLVSCIGAYKDNDRQKAIDFVKKYLDEAYEAYEDFKAVE